MSKKNGKNFSKGSVNKSLTYFTLIVLILALFIVLFFVFREYGIDLFKLGKNSDKVGPFNIEDRCSVIAGQLIHTVENVDSCQLKCRSECYSIGANQPTSKFEGLNNSCNYCECTCN